MGCRELAQAGGDSGIVGGVAQDPLQLATFQGRDLAVVDELAGPVLGCARKRCRIRRPARHGRDVDEQLAPEQSTRRSVRTGLERCIEERRQHGQRRHEVAVQLADPAGSAAEIRVVARTPAVRGMDGIEREEDAPGTRRVRREGVSGRSNDQTFERRT
jgi:hypothetical protein